MRFLISIFVVSALAFLPAMSQAECPPDVNPQTLLDVDDTELSKPASSGTYTVDPGVACRDISCVWEFDYKYSIGRTIVHARIDGSTVSDQIDSNFYLTQGEDRYTLYPSGTVQSSPNEIIFELDATHNSKGHFSDMDFYATYPE